VDILLVKRDGRFSGEAYVVLATPPEIQLALDKNKSYLGRRYVEVFKAKKLVRGPPESPAHNARGQGHNGRRQRRPRRAGARSKTQVAAGRPRVNPPLAPPLPGLL
jgi:hypothetical protein